MSRKSDIDTAWRIFAARVYKDPDAALMVALTTAYDMGRASGLAAGKCSWEDGVDDAKRLRAKVRKMLEGK